MYTVTLCSVAYRGFKRWLVRCTVGLGMCLISLLVMGLGCNIMTCLFNDSSFSLDVLFTSVKRIFTNINYVKKYM